MGGAWGGGARVRGLGEGVGKPRRRRQLLPLHVLAASSEWGELW